MCIVPFTIFFQNLDPLLKILDEDERVILSNITDNLNEGTDNNIVNECEVLRLFGSITPLFNVTEDCSKASWSYLMNMVYVPGSNLQCKSLF